MRLYWAYLQQLRLQTLEHDTRFRMSYTLPTLPHTRSGNGRAADTNATSGGVSTSAPRSSKRGVFSENISEASIYQPMIDSNTNVAARQNNTGYSSSSWACHITAADSEKEESITATFSSPNPPCLPIAPKPDSTRTTPVEKRRHPPRTFSDDIVCFS